MLQSGSRLAGEKGHTAVMIQVKPLASAPVQLPTPLQPVGAVPATAHEFVDAFQHSDLEPSNLKGVVFQEALPQQITVLKYSGQTSGRCRWISTKKTAIMPAPAVSSMAT